MALDFDINDVKKIFIGLVAILIIFSIAAVVIDQVTYAAQQSNPNSTLISSAVTKTESNFNYLGILITFVVIAALAWVALKVFGGEGGA